jgi:glycosyltransferase involved in cell wall biosynthesis
MKISLIHPSRGRPQKAFETANEWIRKAGIDVEYILSIDESDDILSYHQYFYVTEYLINNNKSVVDATNEAAKKSTGDILIYLSDDFKCPNNWAELVLKEFERVTWPMLLKAHDNLQKFETRVCTIPIMNRQLYNLLGYFYHPTYKSMFCDQDLFETCDRLGVIKYAQHLVFPHEHHSIGMSLNDDTYRRSEANWNQGLEVFNRRKKLGFPI